MALALLVVGVRWLVLEEEDLQMDWRLGRLGLALVIAVAWVGGVDL